MQEKEDKEPKITLLENLKLLTELQQAGDLKDLGYGLATSGTGALTAGAILTGLSKGKINLRNIDRKHIVAAKLGKHLAQLGTTKVLKTLEKKYGDKTNKLRQAYLDMPVINKASLANILAREAIGGVAKNMSNEDKRLGHILARKANESFKSNPRIAYVYAANAQNQFNQGLHKRGIGSILSNFLVMGTPSIEKQYLFSKMTPEKKRELLNYINEKNKKKKN